MFMIPHSYPNLNKKDKKEVLKCFSEEYIGFDENLDNVIVKEFQKYCNFNFILTTPSASLSLLLIFKHLKLKVNDEIIMPAINCFSVYNVIKEENLKAVICDTRSRKDFRASYKTITTKITKNTKLIIITHMYGNLVEESIIKLLKMSYPHILILEDFSTSIFSKKRFKLGNYSDFAITSFGSTKPLSGGIGGLLCSKEDIINTNYDLKSGNNISFNIKISRLNQSLLLSQIKSFKKYQKRKKLIINFYKKFLNIYKKNSNDLFRAITFDNPSKLISYLEKKDIKLDIRDSVQPNLVKELNTEEDFNSFNFKKYYSLPLNKKTYTIFKKKGLI